MARIAGINIPPHKHAEIGLTAIFGIGRTNGTNRRLRRGLATLDAPRREDFEEPRSIAPSLSVDVERRRASNRGVKTTLVALAISQVAVQKNKVFIDSGAAASDLTGAKCSPNTIHWTYDTWMLANGTGKALVKSGGDTWFFLTADYAFGAALERDVTKVVEASGADETAQRADATAIATAGANAAWSSRRSFPSWARSPTISAWCVPCTAAITTTPKRW